MKTCGSKFCLAAVAAVGILLNAGAASGAIFIQHLDPLVFFGDGVFDVAPSCDKTGTIGNIWEPVTGIGGCGIVNIDDILVTHIGAPAGTIRFAGPTPPGPVLLGDVTGLYWVNGVLTGIDSLLLTSIANGGAFNNPAGYTLQYVSGHANNVNSGSPIATLLCRTGDEEDSLLFRFSTTDTGLCGALIAGGPAKQEIAVRVPEPGSLALIFGALGAGWLARRKSRKA